MNFVYSRDIYTGGSGTSPEHLPGALSRRRGLRDLIGPWAHGELRAVQYAVSGTYVRRGITGSVVTVGILILIIIIAVAGYFVSLRIHPLAKCRLCNGTGRHYGGVYTYAHRRCRKCGGNGRRDRFGNRFFG